MNTDSRDSIYKDLHTGPLTQQDSQAIYSARKILGILLEYVRPQSVLDVGCGLGTWLSAAQQLGIRDIRGIEGAWLDKSVVHVDRSLITICDLEKGFSLARKFDLAICLEVAEHLSPAAADPFVASLSQHSDVVLFSAAIPFQGGYHHVNEQFPDYWKLRFARHGFHPIDFIRPRIWDDPNVLVWLRQNTLLFVHERVLAANEKFRQETAIPRMLCVAHPEMYLPRMQNATRLINERAALDQLLSQGGTFVVKKATDGTLSITRTQ